MNALEHCITVRNIGGEELFCCWECPGLDCFPEAECSGTAGDSNGTFYNRITQGYFLAFRNEILVNCMT